MPFTFAHPAVVVPLKRRFSRWFNLTALVVGSMSPDFEYFLRMKANTQISHTALGIIVFDLPLVLIVSLIFHRLVKGPLLLHLPQPFSTNFGGAAHQKWIDFSLINLTIFLYSAIIGVLSHLLWDSFTHSNGFFVGLIPILSYQVYLQDVSIPMYKFLQHGSGVVGLLLMAYFLKVCPKREEFNLVNEVAAPKQKAGYWGIVAITVLLVTLIRLSTVEFLAGINLIGTTIVTIISAGMLGILLASWFTLHSTIK